VPDGVLFGSSKAHAALRQLLVKENQLDGVFSRPSGVFKAYAGVSTAIVVFAKGGKTDHVFFYDRGGWLLARRQARYDQPERPA
jgi:type I restriction enzyme M protein